jgi:hypothetical protein
LREIVPEAPGKVDRRVEHDAHFRPSSRGAPTTGLIDFDAGDFPVFATFSGDYPGLDE